MDKKLLAAVGVALAAHAALVLVRPRHPALDDHVDAAAQGEARDHVVEVDLREMFPPPNEPPPTPPTTAAAADHSEVASLARVEPGERRPVGKSSGDVAAAGAPSAAGSGASAPATSGEPLAAATPPAGKTLPGDSRIPSLLGAPGAHGVIWPTMPGGSKEAEAAAKLDRALSASIDAKGLEAGGGYGGPVVSAAHDATRGPDGPSIGRATLDVVIDSKGAISRIDLISHDDLVGWQAVARAMKAKLAKQTLRVPPTGGVVVRVEVAASMRMPSGAKSAGPDVGVGANDYGVGVSGSFDLADIGSKPVRVVAVKVLSERRTD